MKHSILFFFFFCTLWMGVRMEASGVGDLSDLKKAIAPLVLSEKQIEVFNTFFREHTRKYMEYGKQRDLDSMYVKMVKLSDEKRQFLKTHLTEAQYKNYLAYRYQNELADQKERLEDFKKITIPALTKEQEQQLLDLYMEEAAKRDSIREQYKFQRCTQEYYINLLIRSNYPRIEKILTEEQNKNRAKRREPFLQKDKEYLEKLKKKMEEEQKSLQK